MRDPLLYIIAAATLIIATVNVSTKLSDADSYGAEMAWQNPATTEFSSGFALIIIMPFLFAFFDHQAITFGNWHRKLSFYIVASILFSLTHVFLMVGARQLAWPILFDRSYDFFAGGPGALLYEYQKDVVTFLMYLLIATLQRQVILARTAKASTTDPIMLKSGSTTILLQPAEFLFAKSAGNYAEITSLSGTHLARITLAELGRLLQSTGSDAVRIHRSCIVNRTAILETAPIAGGDLSVKLRGGERLRASRRYKDQLTQ